jgi:hypothetical protein
MIDDGASLEHEVEGFSQGRDSASLAGPGPLP